MIKERYLKPNIKVLFMGALMQSEGIGFDSDNQPLDSKPYLDTDMWDSENSTDDNSPNTGGSIWDD